jgi:hypothetical protein
MPAVTQGRALARFCGWTVSLLGRYSGMDNGWAISLMDVPLTEFNKSIIKYPSIKRFPGGASNDLLPNLQHPENPVPAMDPNKVPDPKPTLGPLNGCKARWG